MPLDKRRLAGTQEQNRVRHLFRLPHPLHGCNVYSWLQPLRHLLRARGQGRLYYPRADTVDPDAVAGVVDSIGARHVNDGGLRGTVGSYLAVSVSRAVIRHLFHSLTCTRSRHDPQLARDINHSPTLPWVFRQRLLLQHLPHRSTRREPHPLAVNIHDGVIRAYRRLCGPGVVPEDPGAVDGVVHAAEGLCRLGHERADKRLVRDITRAGGYACVQVGFQQDLSGVGQRVGVNVRDGEPRTSGLDKRRGDCGANA